MKILHKSKRAVAPPPQVAELINKLLATPNDDLADVLSQIESWKWPRSDLNAWIKVLNKFDAVLEEVIRDYDVDKLQINPFTPATKRTVSEILRFERMLLENSTNRKMFSSYDRLNSLLFTSDLDILILAENLLLRPSQQYSAQPSVSHALSIQTPRLLSLAQRWPRAREYGLSLYDLATEKGKAKVEALPPDAREVDFTFYRIDSAAAAADKNKMDIEPDSSSSPMKKGSTSTSPGQGAVAVHIDEQTLQSKPAIEVLADAVETYSVPESEKLELLCRIRTAQCLAPGHEEDRQKLVISRLLAIAIFAHTHPESQATSSIFLYEPDIITSIAELLQVDRGVSDRIQVAAISALDALARYRSKLSEVLAAVNAGINHGIIMSLVRAIVADIARPESTITNSYVEAILGFLSYIASHASGGNMIVGAGIVPLLIQLIDNRLPKRLTMVSKTMQLVDNVLYSFTNAFNLFCSSRGVTTLVDRIGYEVDHDIEQYEQGSTEMPVARSAVLKHLLRSLHRMMQASGTSEGLRGLIDTSILKSIKKIIEHRSTFGSNVYPIAINVMATFVHNEPTALPIIQETGLPEAFYKAVESGVEPAIETLQAIPNAIGALCLNEAGQAQLAARPSIIPSIFSIFTSESHIKVLLDKENAVLLGSAIDELIRHHPTLKTSVFQAITATLGKIETLGNEFVVPNNIRHWYQLSPVAPAGAATTPATEDVAMSPVEQESAAAGEESSADASAPSEDSSNHENIIVSFVDIFNRFLEGLFQHTAHCREFVTSTDGLDRLAKLTALPCLPYDFASSVASDSIVQVIRTMAEVSTTETMALLTKSIKESLEAAGFFWMLLDKQSTLVPMITPTADNIEDVNRKFRLLTTLHVRLTLLSDVFATASYTPTRVSNSLLQALTSETSVPIVADLGNLHRATVWENILLKAGLAHLGIDLGSSSESRSTSPLTASPERPPVSLPEADGMVSPSGQGATASTSTSTPKPADPSAKTSTESKKKDDTRYRNAAALKHLTHVFPVALAPFFQALVKMFYTRRNTDQAFKKQISDTASIISKIAIDHFTKTHFTEGADKLRVSTYYTAMLGFTAVLLVDEERNTTMTIQTVQLWNWYRAGGLEGVLSTCQRYVAVIDGLYRTSSDSRSEATRQELAHALGVLKVALHLLLPLISSKPLFESPQTALVMTRKPETDPDYFAPHDFLVRLRLAILPLLQSMWQAPWIKNVPPTIRQPVIHAVLELIGAENEEARTEGLAEALPTPGWARPTEPDENRIRQLTDMGFPRSAVERALRRTHNNISAATELLLAHPFPLPADPDTATPAEPSAPSTPPAEPPAAAPAEAPSEPSTATQAPEAGPSNAAESSEQTQPVEAEAPKKKPEDWRAELNAIREPLRASVSRIALTIVDEDPSLIFDLHSAFIKPSGEHQKQAVRDLVNDVKTFSPYAYDTQEQPLANRCRLLALVLCETPSSFDDNLRQTLLDNLLALLLSSPTNAESDSPPVPKWLAAHLLVVEGLLTLAASPKAITLPKEGEPVPQEDVSVGPALVEARKVVFDFCLRLMAIPDLPDDPVLSSLRIFVICTRDHSMACEFVKKDGLSRMFRRLGSSAIPGSSSYVAIILRHVAEDLPTVESIMKQNIKRFLNQPRARNVDVLTYTRNCSAMALRDPKAFLRATEALCQLASPYATTHQISLKPESTSDTAKGQEKMGDADMQLDAPSFTNVSETLDAMVHYLIAELMRVVKIVQEPSAPDSEPAPASTTAESSTSAPPAPSTSTTSLSEAQPPKASESSAEKAPADPKAGEQQYACFLMQCLAELLFSYDSCKMAFLTYSPKKRTQTPAKEGATKYKSSTLHFLLSELVTYGAINPQSPAFSKSRLALCNWAMSVLVALCVDSSTTHDSKEVPAELASVRKFVLEALSRSIKDAQNVEGQEARYGRLLALSDACYRLLTVKVNMPTRKSTDDTPTHIARVMLEKGFVATLTNALSDVDLNYPHVRQLVASMLRPLEHLTKVAIRMSKSGKYRESADDKKPPSVYSSESSESEDEHMDADDREETPDLYRNSALGMFTGEMEDNQYPDDELMDEDEEEDDVDMEYGEETGSEDTSATEDDEDEIQAGAEGPGDAWEESEDEEDAEMQDEEDDEGEDDEGDDDEEDIIDEEGPDEDDEGDEDEEGEMIWEDIEAEGLRAPRIPGDEGDEDDEQDGIHLVADDVEDEQGELSDEDPLETGNFVEDLIGIGATLTNGITPRDTSGVFAQRRSRLADETLQVFGRPRGGPPAPPEATTHPLLLDTTAGGRSSAPQARIRVTQRFPQNGLIQTIDDLIGGGAAQFFHRVIARSGAELGLAGPAMMGLDRHVFLRRPGVSAAFRERSQRAGHGSGSSSRELEPLLTIQRWAEELKIVNGDFANERATKLANHVTLTLLPSAIEAARLKKVKEEEEARRKEEEAKAKAEEEEAAKVKAEEEARKKAEAAASQTDTAANPEAEVANSSNEPAVVDEPMDVTPDAAPQEASTAPSEPAAAEASTSAPPERVTVMINGNPVDITDTGIDPTFLEALPDDMREEVLNQHIRDQRAARIERPADSQISDEFLDALPPEIRAEIIQQEAIERARRRTEELARSATAAAVPAEIDNASFIASLDPTLRQAVLLDQDDGFIQSLPSHMIAEAGAYLEDRNVRASRVAARTAVPSPRPSQGTSRKPPAHHDAIQLLDKTGIAVLVRLLFFPQVMRKSLLHKVLVNLCENSKTRTELFTLLLNILNDGTVDVATVDTRFSQLSMKTPKPQTPKAIGKQRAGSDYLGVLPIPKMQTDIVPDLVAQRCLEALSYIVNENEASSLFFLTEHELSAGLRRTMSKKGKGKERQAPQLQYPVVLLLSLLDRPTLLKTPSIMEQVATLLATVTRPLTSLKDKDEKAKEKPQDVSQQPTSQKSAAQSQEQPQGSTQSAPQPSSTATDTVQSTGAAAASSGTTKEAGAPAAQEERVTLSHPPTILHNVLRLIVNFLTIGECTGRTFQQSLALIQHLSYIPDARDVIAEELKTKAQEFGQALYQDLDELANAMQKAEKDDVISSTVVSKFSASTSVQAKFLRVLKTIDYMFTPKSLASVTPEAAASEDAQKVQSIYESFRFTPLWKRLGDCLAIIEQKPETEIVATVLLPLIESLMVVCKYVGTKKGSDLTALRGSMSPRSPRSPTLSRDSMEELFVSFTDAHRKILNLMVRNNPSLMSGSFSLLVNNPRVLDFDNKRNYFTQQLHRRPHTREHYGTIQLNVRRARVFEDSFQHLQRKTGDQIKYGKLSVRFYDEEGVDAGGVTREWFQILARQMFDPNNALFQPCAADRQTYQPNKNSWVNPEHLSFFKFVGRVIGKAIYDGRLLDAYFAKSLYRQLLGKPVDYRDVEWVDPEYYNSLCWILENDPTPLDLTFSVEADEFGVQRIVPLKEGGETLPVTNENKREFVQLSAQYRLYSSIKSQIEALSEGFYEIIPKDMITIFNEQELELLISGTPDIDVDEWRAATDYVGYTSSDPNIVWWWRALKSFDRDERAKVLSFATGTSRVPLGGFTELQGVQGTQKFSIHRAYGDEDRLPSAHTCFNQIDLPQYSSYEKLRQQLLLAISEGATGFAFA
ncbi:uncharacterized protein SCHCODRAFT_02751097 [Schizophyllum commune H4-8]|uniref:uncharacterized protein n=1 Tax=Schizophyllum commune (strain H4-8 / FGSC 9210) TaxID=578458 RepID=UPI002160AD97|nr:uncharacterized protein SCHCODRAFT_02751097 [Schizophyllum commune H4-8]KAI5889571.1 hypothetical protein SCHCODRAFT_02751097 [Schizophyllum commune H4-8]